MAGVTVRGGMFYAVWKVDGVNKFKSTRIPAAGDKSMSRQQAEAMARQIANSMEASAKGAAVDKALDAVRAVASLQGTHTRVPSVREFLESVPETTSESSEKNRRRAFRVFLDYLGPGAQRRMDSVTYDTCRGFIIEQLRQVSRKTVTQYHTYIMRAFADAQDIHGYISRNPMRPVSVAQEARLLSPEKGADKQVKEAFTAEEMRRLLTEAPLPWRDMVAVSYYLGGLRVGDVCMMRWDAVDLRGGVVSLVEEKTKRRRVQPIISELRAVLERLRDTQGGGEEYLFPWGA